MGSKTGLSEIPNVQIVSQSGGNVQIGPLPNMERSHLWGSTAGSLEAQLRAGKPTCISMPPKCRHGFLNCVSYFSKSNFSTADTPFLLSRFLTFGHLLYSVAHELCSCTRDIYYYSYLIPRHMFIIVVANSGGHRVG